MAQTDQIYLDQILENDLHQSLQRAGYAVKEAKEGGAALRQLYLPAGPEQQKEQVLWRYRAFLGDGAWFVWEGEDILKRRVNIEVGALDFELESANFLQNSRPL